MFFMKKKDRKSQEQGEGKFKAEILCWHGAGYKSSCVSNSKVFFGIIINTYFVSLYPTSLFCCSTATVRFQGTSNLWKSIFVLSNEKLLSQ